MSKKPKAVFVGDVVLHEHIDGLQVPLIHRECYDDWPLSKDKSEAGELLPKTAVREIWEETRVAAHPGPRLSSIRYKVGRSPKAVRYWRSAVSSQRLRWPDHEASAVKWSPVDKVLGKITYPGEYAMIKAAVTVPPTSVLLTVRHVRAM